MHKLLLVLLVCIGGCTHAPETGRSQFIVMSHAQEMKLGQDAFSKLLKEETLVTSGKNYEMVQRVGERVAIAANGLYPNAVQGYKWKFALIKNEEMVNAWALPGGKCGIYTGLLPITENEDALAIVMAHEVAHVVASHGAERSSRAMISTIIAGVAMKKTSKGNRALGLAAYGLGVALPFSRGQEAEADQLGLYIAAYAGYDPRQAIPLWKRMEKSGKKAPFEFMSTHPTSKTRMNQIKGWLPKAMMYYDNAVAHEAAQQQ